MLKRIAPTLLSACLLTTMVRPADANFFERLFGGFVRRVQPQLERALPDMSPVTRNPPPSGGNDWRFGSENGPRSAYCVRTCDGHFFPVQAQGNMSVTQMCRAFCPSTETKIYSGGGIDNAAAPDGSHYRDLKNAFLYRKQLVSNCTCNGKTPFGLAKLDINSDPTLVRGDMVATRDGLVAVIGRDHNGPQFAKADKTRDVSAPEGQRTSQTRTSTRHATRRHSPAGPVETTGSAAGED